MDNNQGYSVFQSSKVHLTSAFCPLPSASNQDFCTSADWKTLYVLLKREENLKQEQKEKLVKMKDASPVIKAMHELKEEFIRVFDKSKNLGEGTFKLIEWLKKAERSRR